MFGYVVPVKDQLACSDFMLYRSFYCGICKVTGKYYGQLPRFTTNYDMVFLSVLLHEYTNSEYTFEHKGCVLNPFKKKVSVCSNELFDKIAAANIILSYYKAEDGCIDREGAKMRVVRRLLKKPYKRASALLPGVDSACKTWYDNLRALERADCPSPDRAADCFAQLLKEVACNLVKGYEVSCTENRQSVRNGGEPDGGFRFQASAAHFEALCYNVGKFVYLADALDDAEEDFRKKRYNPFLAAYGSFANRTKFIDANREPITFILASSVNRAIESFNYIKHGFRNGGDLLQNILYKGLRAKCEELLSSAKKLKKPRL